MTPKEHRQVLRLMEVYFEGLYLADSAMLRTIFHPKLSYICATQGDEMYLDLETYLARIDNRVPPAQRGDPRDESVLEIAFGSDRIARITARMSMLGRDYLDFLTLVRDGADWRIVTKAFAYVPRKE